MDSPMGNPFDLPIPATEPPVKRRHIPHSIAITSGGEDRYAKDARHRRRLSLPAPESPVASKIDRVFFSENFGDSDAEEYDRPTSPGPPPPGPPGGVEPTAFQEAGTKTPKSAHCSDVRHRLPNCIWTGAHAVRRISELHGPPRCRPPPVRRLRRVVGRQRPCQNPGRHCRAKRHYVRLRAPHHLRIRYRCVRHRLRWRTARYGRLGDAPFAQRRMAAAALYSTCDNFEEVRETLEGVPAMSEVADSTSQPTALVSQICYNFTLPFDFTVKLSQTMSRIVTNEWPSTQSVSMEQKIAFSASFLGIGNSGARCAASILVSRWVCLASLSTALLMIIVLASWPSPPHASETKLAGGLVGRFDTDDIWSEVHGFNVGVPGLVVDRAAHTNRVGLVAIATTCLRNQLPCFATLAGSATRLQVSQDLCPSPLDQRGLFGVPIRVGFMF